MTDDADPGKWQELVYSRERQEFVASVRAHLGAIFGPEGARRCFEHGQPVDTWHELAESEYTLVGLPESMGGVGSLIDTVAMLEAAGHELVPVPLLSTVMAWQTVALVDPGRVVMPEQVAALALIDDPDEAAPIVVLDGALAQQLVAVDVRTPAVGIAGGGAGPDEVHRHVDPSRPIAVFDAAAELTWRSVGDAALSSDALLAPARIALAADLVGVGAAALERAVQHAQDREQFGKKIGAFQGVKHRLADCYVAVERARSLTRAAAVTCVEDRVDASGVELSLLAKAAGADAAVECTRAYVQVLGAMGMTFEADAHLYFRRAQQTAPVLGSAELCYRKAAAMRSERARRAASAEVAG